MTIQFPLKISNGRTEVLLHQLTLEEFRAAQTPKFKENDRRCTVCTAREFDVEVRCLSKRKIQELIGGAIS